MSGISTHVLDTSRGRPAAGIPVRLYRASSAETDSPATETLVAEQPTDHDGRCKPLLPAGDVRPGRYRLWFGLADYLGPAAFYPEVSVTFHVAAPGESYHVPLLLNPFGYSTYRGS